LIEALQAKVTNLASQAEALTTEKSDLQLEVDNLIEENEKLHQEKIEVNGL